MLEVSDLAVSYGGIQALKGVSISVRPGEFVGVLGANGAGKSTMLMALSGAVRPQAGTVVLDGHDITSLPQHERVSRGMAIVPEGRGMFGPLTVLENLELGAFHRRRSGARAISSDLEHVFELFPILKIRVKQLSATLSGGEQQMLAIARALMSRPKLLLLDEPSLGLAPKVVTGIMQTLQQLHSEGLTCLMVEQDAHVALNNIVRGYVFKTGEVVAEGSAEDLKGSSIVEQIYLGEEARTS